MVLHDVDDLDGAVREAARVLEPGGRLCLAIVHPMNSAGRFEGEAADAPFRINDTRRTRLPSTTNTWTPAHIPICPVAAVHPIHQCRAAQTARRPATATSAGHSTSTLSRRIRLQAA
jgi:ubiquinone/menaquinone biosynthesis C-methylase UbiE